MSRQFREARKKNNLKLTVAATMPGVSQPTLSSWEPGVNRRRSIILQKWQISME